MAEKVLQQCGGSLCMTDTRKPGKCITGFLATATYGVVVARKYPFLHNTVLVYRVDTMTQCRTAKRFLDSLPSKNEVASIGVTRHEDDETRAWHETEALCTTKHSLHDYTHIHDSAPLMALGPCLNYEAASANLVCMIMFNVQTRKAVWA